jgi:CHASE3 domain sensor protein
VNSPKVAVRSRRIGGALPGRTFAGFVTAVLAVLAMAGFSYWSLAEGTRSGSRVTQTLEAVSHLQALLSSLKDAETGQRGYLLTGAESYLDPFTSAEQSLPTEIAQARR